MDERNKQPGQSAYASATGRMKEQISEKVSDVKERVSEFGREAAQKFDESRESAAGALENASFAFGVVTAIVHGSLNRGSSKQGNARRASIGSKSV